MNGIAKGGGVDKIKIVLPYIPDSLNAIFTKYWSRRYTEAIKISGDIYWLLRAAFKKPIPKWYKAKIIFTGYNCGYDYDNFVGCLKPVMDGLKNTKIILDDSSKYVKASYELLKDKGERRVEIKIEKL